MFGIFQADLPIGRRIWLLALTLIITTLVTGAPFKLLADPAAFALAMLIYTGHAFLLGVLYSLLPNLIIGVFELYGMYRRSFEWDASSVLFEGYRYEVLTDAVVNLSVVFAAARAAHRFGDRSLIVTGTVGLIVMLIAEAFDVGELFSRRPNALLLELKGHSVPGARVFFAGELLAETTLDTDFARSIAQLLSAKWTFLPDAAPTADVAWLHKDAPGVGAAARLLKRRNLTRSDSPNAAGESSSPQIVADRRRKGRRRGRKRD